LRRPRPPTASRRSSKSEGGSHPGSVRVTGLLPPSLKLRRTQSLTLAMTWRGRRKPQSPSLRGALATRQSSLACGTGLRRAAPSRGEDGQRFTTKPVAHGCGRVVGGAIDFEQNAMIHRTGQSRLGFFIHRRQRAGRGDTAKPALRTISEMS
jgi:hypothetical protein